MTTRTVISTFGPAEGYSDSDGKVTETTNTLGNVPTRPAGPSPADQPRPVPRPVQNSQQGWVCPKCNNSVRPDLNTCPSCTKTVEESSGDNRQVIID